MGAGKETGQRLMKQPNSTDLIKQLLFYAACTKVKIKALALNNIIFWTSQIARSDTRTTKQQKCKQTRPSGQTSDVLHL